ncbi:MAG: hypothetical protein Q7T35_00720 [Nitrosomonas sp.]|nr:hypothetical protein [Nitrosomonas sp.]
MKPIIQYGVIMLLVSGFIVPDANALEFQLGQKGDKKILLLSGGFEPGDNLQFGETLRRAGRVDEVWFDSSGGNVIEGMEIGRRIRAAQLATRVPRGARCASICAFAFLGGVLRQVDPGGAFIVHMFSKVGNKEFVKKIENVIKQEGSDGAMAVIMYIEQSSAQMARMQADYLLEMSISLRLLFPNYDTGHDEGHALSRTEMVSYNVVNVNDGY